MWTQEHRRIYRREDERPLSVGQGTFAGAPGNGEDAPIAAIPAITPEHGGSTPSRTFDPAHLGL
jgi:hypothetical protein